MASPDPAAAGGLGPPAAALDTLEMLQAAGDLMGPAAVTRELPWLTGELLKIALTRSGIGYDDHDPRFADPTWRGNPFFQVLGQGYRLFEEWTDRLADTVDGPWERQARARYLASIITATFAPTNFFLTNPAALKRALETGGRSVLHGAQNMARDLARGGTPRMVSKETFRVGVEVGGTPGAVVYRDELFELLHYKPTTSAVRARPLLMVPPQLNRHYVLDLAPGRSLVEFTVGQGIQTFMIVWRNPRSELGHGHWGLDDYLAAHAKAAEVVQQITQSDSLNWLGLCAGGITTALMLGYLAARGEASVGSATFIVTMLTNDWPNVVGMMDTNKSRGYLKRAASAGQVFRGASLRSTFAWLRPNDLVFNYLVSGWLLGEDPPAFDVLAWNDDATAMSSKFALECTQVLVDRPAREAGITVLGTGIDLAKVDCDSFHIAGSTDHIAPWRACYSATQVLGGDKEMVVVNSGHIQSFVNPVGSTRYNYWTAPPAPGDPDQWMEGAALEHGSWWPRWAQWLIARSGPEQEASGDLGSPQFPPLDPAPGRYVHE